MICLFLWEQGRARPEPHSLSLQAEKGSGGAGAPGGWSGGGGRSATPTRVLTPSPARASRPRRARPVRARVAVGGSGCQSLIRPVSKLPASCHPPNQLCRRLASLRDADLGGPAQTALPLPAGQAAGG